MKKRWKKPLYWAVIAVLAAVFVYSAYSLIAYYVASQKNAETYDHLAQLVADRPTIPLPGSVDTETIPQETEPEQEDEVLQVLPEYAQVYALNSDLVGWISIDGTKINYPVVQSGKDNPNYYLKRNFEKNYSSHGCIYVSEDADVFTPSDNVTIYGHRMGDHSMFGQLGLYTENAFWQTHQYIRFDTLEERHLYQVICVFAISASQAESFPYHSFVNAADEEAFNAFIAKCMALSYYDTGITAQYGDKLITLSTCEYTRSNGRLVVVAKQII